MGVSYSAAVAERLPVAQGRGLGGARVGCSAPQHEFYGETISMVWLSPYRRKSHPHKGTRSAARLVAGSGEGHLKVDDVQLYMQPGITTNSNLNRARSEP